MDALYRAYVQSSQIAAIAIVVDAIEDQAARFTGTLISYYRSRTGFSFP